MKTKNLENFTKGWLVGDFEPSILRHKDIEVGIAYHTKNEPTQKHFHTSSDEYNVIVSGKMNVNGKVMTKGSIFVYERNEVSDCEFLEDTILVIIRIPSAPGDKVVV